MTPIKLRKTSVLESRKVIETALFNVERRLIRFSSGQECWLERLTTTRGATVLIVPFLDRDTVILVREYPITT